MTVWVATCVMRGGGASAVDTELRDERETWRAVRAEFESLSANVPASTTVSIPAAMLPVLRARVQVAGMTGLGRGRDCMPDAERHAQETAKREGRELRLAYLAQAKAAGIERPYRWARQQAAQAVHRRLGELGWTAPSTETIAKTWKF
jgi:hypothetical protein